MMHFVFQVLIIEYFASNYLGTIFGFIVRYFCYVSRFCWEMWIKRDQKSCNLSATKIHWGDIFWRKFAGEETSTSYILKLNDSNSSCSCCHGASYRGGTKLIWVSDDEVCGSLFSIFIFLIWFVLFYFSFLWKFSQQFKTSHTIKSLQDSFHSENLLTWW